MYCCIKKECLPGPPLSLGLHMPRARPQLAVHFNKLRKSKSKSTQPLIKAMYENPLSYR